MPLATYGLADPYFTKPKRSLEPKRIASIALNEPYFGPGSAELQPIDLGLYQVIIGGHRYLIDTSFEPYRREAFRHRTITSQRQSIAFNNEPGEGTINTEGLWRRGAFDFGLGSGQIYLDRKDAAENRFATSKGIDPWTPWTATLLQDTKVAYTCSNPNGFTRAIAVGDLVYILQNDTVVFTADWVHFSQVAGLPTDGSLIDLCTDGHTVYVSCYNNNGIYQTFAGTSTATQLVSSGYFDLIGFVNDRLMACSGPAVYNITSPSTLITPDSPPPDPLFTHPNQNWRWSCIAEGSSQIYLGGYVSTGSPSFTPLGHGGVYRTTINSTGTALTIPVLALPMAVGEYPTALYGYLNYIFLGTNQGIRMCQTLAAFDPTGNQGDLRAGPLIPNLTQPVSSAVKGITGDGRFVYFTWVNFDDISSGLGRLDLSTFIDALAPAYASDLMVTGQGDLTGLDWDPITGGPMIACSVVTIFGVRVSGVFTQDPAKKVSSGYIDSGRITFGIPDDKIAMLLDMRCQEPLTGTFAAQISVDGTAFADLGTKGDVLPRAPFDLGQLRGEEFVIRTVLNSDGENGSPTLNRWTLKALPAVVSGTMISAVIRLYSGMEAQGGVAVTTDPYAEYLYLEELRQSQRVVDYVEGPLTVRCTVDQLDWLPFKFRDSADEGGFEGDCVVYLKTLSG